MTVYDNLSFGMKLKKCSTEQIEAAVKKQQICWDWKNC